MTYQMFGCGVLVLQPRHALADKPLISMDLRNRQLVYGNVEEIRT